MCCACWEEETLFALVGVLHFNGSRLNENGNVFREGLWEKYIIFVSILEDGIDLNLTNMD